VSLLKGTVSLTRYGLQEPPPEPTEEFVAERLKHNAFVSIDDAPEPESMGWVEPLNPLAADFGPGTFYFGEVIILGLRVDGRKVPAKLLNRYFNLATAQAEKISQRPLSADQRNSLKAKVRADLLARIPVSTDVFEVCWFIKTHEVWLLGQGAKLREKFEDLWRRTFGLGLILKIPYLLARELLPAGVGLAQLDQTKAAAFYGGGKG